MYPPCVDAAARRVDGVRVDAVRPRRFPHAGTVIRKPTDVSTIGLYTSTLYLYLIESHTTIRDSAKAATQLRNGALSQRFAVAACACNQCTLVAVAAPQASRNHQVKQEQ